MACPNAHECPNMMSSLPKFGMFVAVKLLFKLPTMDELNDFFNCKVIICIVVHCSIEAASYEGHLSTIAPKDPKLAGRGRTIYSR